MAVRIPVPQLNVGEFHRSRLNILQLLLIHPEIEILTPYLSPTEVNQSGLLRVAIVSIILILVRLFLEE
ncbi:MAG: hypothetical protein WB660_03955 [Candidatus Sulfotelmatobacter sp.]